MQPRVRSAKVGTADLALGVLASTDVETTSSAKVGGGESAGVFATGVLPVVTTAAGVARSANVGSAASSPTDFRPLGVLAAVAAAAGVARSANVGSGVCAVFALGVLATGAGVARSAFAWRSFSPFEYRVLGVCTLKARS